VIPGASKESQLDSNLSCRAEKPFTNEEMDGVRKIYDTLIRDQVHHLW